MPLDKKNFQGGLNRDDDSRTLPGGDYYYAQNVRILTSENRSGLVLENLRGMEKEPLPNPPNSWATRSWKVIGSYEDKPTNCIYYFVWAGDYKHLILEYNINTDLVTTVFRDVSNPNDNVLNFREDVLITGVNKIDDILYWVSDNDWIGSKGEVRHNEPKYLNVEKSKLGWATYYADGDFDAAVGDFDIETMYPFEFYAAGDGAYAAVQNEFKLKYIDVCKYRPHAPIYFYQTPIRNISGGSIELAGLGVTGPPDEEGETDIVDTETLNPGDITYTDIGLASLESVSQIDFAYKKNNLYGFMWQFACRYVYKNNETSAYSDWSSVLPGPQYATNKVDEAKQNAYNEVRVWYHNGPSDVKSIEIVARKCSFIETKPDEGNKGEFYLVATVDNYYYDSTFSSSPNPNIGIQYNYGWTAVTSRGVPYIDSIAANNTSIAQSSNPAGFIDFRNDGVYSQVDPVAFDKTFDQVPHRAKAQEIVNENRIIYGNYIDGFNQVKTHYHLSPEYGPAASDQQFVTNPLAEAEYPTGWWSGGGEYYQWAGFNGTQSGDAVSGGYTFTFSSDDAMHSVDRSSYGHNSDDGDEIDGWWGGAKVFGWDMNMYKIRVKIIFPTTVQSGQVFRLRVHSRCKWRARWGDDGSRIIVPFGEGSSGSAISDHYKYEYFGWQIDLSKQMGGAGISALVDQFVTDIKAMFNHQNSSSGGGIDDIRGSTDPSSDFYNPNHNSVNGGKQYGYWRCDSDGDQSYEYDSMIGASPMRLCGIKKVDGTQLGGNGTDNAIYMTFSPYGQEWDKLDGGSEPNSCVADRVERQYSYLPGAVNETFSNPSAAWGTEKVSNMHLWKTIGGGAQPVPDVSGGSNRSGLTCNSSCNGWCCTSCGGVCGSAMGCADSWGYWREDGNGVNDVNDQVVYESDDNENGLHNQKQTSYIKGSNSSRMGEIQDSGSTWSDITGLNMPWSTLLTNTDNASAFKSGAWHRFGLVYYDEKGRSSTVMLNQEDTRDALYDRNSSCYVGFPTERYNQQGNNNAVFDSATPANNNPSGLTTTALENNEKLGPADIYWKIFHRPPLWAEHYQWVYARNTSIGKFLQFRISLAWVNKGAKQGTEAYEADADTKIYLALDTMDGMDWSYSQRNRSMIGEWSFADGDRIRLIADKDGNVMSKHYDLKVSDVGHYPDRFELGGGNMEETQVVTESPVGGLPGLPETAKKGKFVIIDDPQISGMTIGDADSVFGVITDWHKVTVELYRPKKNTNDELSLYYEISEKFPINNSGNANCTHMGPLGSQVNGDFATYLGEEKTLNQPAMGVFRRGDVWYKPREAEYVALGGLVQMPPFWCESYFLNDFMSTNHNNIGRPHVSSPYAKEQRRKATLTYSDVYQPDTQYNGFHSFNFSQRPYMDYDLSLGSIQKLVARDTNLVMMQENKISKVMVNKDIITNPGGDQGLTLSKNVLPDNADPVAGEYGVCLNPESVAVHTSTIYFTDIKRGAVLRIGGDGITPISDYKMTDFFRDKMDEYQQILESDYPSRLGGGGLFIIGGYDPRHGEYVVTFPPIINVTDSVSPSLATSTPFFNLNGIAFNSAATNWEALDSNGFTITSMVSDDAPIILLEGSGQPLDVAPVTLAFNERANRWTSFYTYYPEYYGTLNRTFISFKGGRLYRHDADSVNHNMFYDNPFPAESSVAISFNEDVSTVKSFNALTVEGSPKKQVIPLVSIAANYASVTIAATTDSANLEGVNVNFVTNDIVNGDTVWYNDNGTFRLIGTVVSIVDTNTIQSNVSEINAFIAASSTGTGDLLLNVFIISKDATAYRADFETNINASYLTHRLSYNNDDAGNHAPGTWVEREDVLGTDIGFGTTNSAGGEYFGLGDVDSSTLSTSLTGDGTDFTTSGAQVGEIVYYDNSGVITSIGVISAINSDTLITLSVNASTTLNKEFMFVVKNSKVEGDRLKGHYMDTKLTKRTKEKIHMFAANANIINSELTNK